MSSACILCPGPSLPRTRYSKGLPYTVVIALNEAASHYAHNLACFGDIEGKCTDGPYLTTQELASRYPLEVGARCAFKWDTLQLPRTPAQVNYSSVVALAYVLQVHPLCEEIDMYGCDMRSSKRMPGKIIEEENPDRWKHELADLQWVIERKPRPEIIVRRITSFQEMTR